MQKFDRISIAEISKQDMAMIIDALEFAGNKGNKIEYLSLRNNIIKELSELAESSEDEFIKYLKSCI
ncbi:hypothetical protein [Sporosalibacterium faouarense]|uniref:hypothetical protein n=1 Tax=Sporosalibacterium faouarense TaxID=516123 RepID=UPI00141C302D|nr:hypothetical protein [Sporosalibacterium faouarense]MTI49495.1 hypothetical protein [Bacillota bacterium]